MGWFDEQIRARMKSDADALKRSFADMSGIVTGGRPAGARPETWQAATDAIGEILRFYGVPLRDLPGDITQMDEQLENLLHPSGVMRRAVCLEGAWYRHAVGPMLGRLEGGAYIALIPRPGGGYAFTDPATGRRARVNAANSARIDRAATCFYRPFPLRSVNPGDLARFMARSLSLGDAIYLALAAALATVLGFATPYANNLLFGRVISGGETGLIGPVAVMLACATASAALVGVVRNLLLERMNQKMRVPIEAAVMMRVLSLPATFFRRFSAGELSQRVFTVGELCAIVLKTVFSVGLTGLFSLGYLGQIAFYAPSMTLTAFVVVAVSVLVSCLTIAAQTRAQQRRMESDARQSGLVYQLISGIRKIKLCGAENRAFAKWADCYRAGAGALYNPPIAVRLTPVFSVAVTLAGTILLYERAGATNVSQANFMAFSSAFALALGAVMLLSDAVSSVAQIRPILQMLAPILDQAPEVSASRRMVTRLSGQIELSGVSFRYAPDAPLVIDDLSLRVQPGQYVAIVGATGCGKSTLLRLMLGFEKPDKGAIYYDGKDLNALDLHSLRRNIGSVLQNGKLFQGDIYSNIVVCAPWLTLEDAWKAAEAADIARDIRAMPMGMNTLITEGTGGISGGQRQRLLIARAIAAKPRILLFDEATSALDNISQKKITQALSMLACTRVVVAHRLSTIRQCDRIVVLEGGRIVQDGTYEELSGREGAFQRLIASQRLKQDE